MTLTTASLAAVDQPVGNLPAVIVSTVEPRQFQVEGDDTDIYHIVAKSDQDWIPLKKYGCYVQCDKGSMNEALYCAAMDQDGSMDSEIYEITAPDSMEFLDAVNAIFGTDFAFADFPGR